MNDIDANNKTDRELLVLLVDHVNSLCEQISLQNGRVGKLEAWRDRIVGAIGLLIFSLTVAVSIILRLIK